MKALLFTLAVFGTPSLGQEVTVDTLCASFGEVAEVTMLARQMEIPLSEVLSNIEEGGDPSGLLRKIILDAYSKPAYSIPENQQEAAAQFRNHWELQCFTTYAD